MKLIDEDFVNNLIESIDPANPLITQHQLFISTLHKCQSLCMEYVQIFENKKLWTKKLKIEKDKGTTNRLSELRDGHINDQGMVWDAALN